MGMIQIWRQSCCCAAGSARQSLEQKLEVVAGKYEAEVRERGLRDCRSKADSKRGTTTTSWWQNYALPLALGRLIGRLFKDNAVSEEEEEEEEGLFKANAGGGRFIQS